MFKIRDLKKIQKDLLKLNDGDHTLHDRKHDEANLIDPILINLRHHDLDRGIAKRSAHRSR